MDIPYYLDKVDYVIIEMGECAIGSYSYGFAQYLNECLNTYKPNASEKRYADTNLDPAAGIGLSCQNGFWNMEIGHVWASQDAAITLRNAKISEKGLEIEYIVNENTLYEPNRICIYVNQHLTKDIEYTESGQQKIYIYTDELESPDGETYDIELISSNSFNPLEMGMSTDNRNLALDILYVY